MREILNLLRTVRVAFLTAVGSSGMAALLAIVALIMTPASEAFVRQLMMATAVGAGAASIALILHLGPVSAVWRALSARTKRVERRANVDEMTGCWNRRRFMEILNDKLAEIEEAKDAGRAYEEITMLLLDVDHFKMINDTFGHANGDEVLRMLGQCARENQSWTVGRLGGDEFAILVAGSDPRLIGPEARNFADKLASLLRNNEKARGFQGISVGVASAPQDASRSQDLMHKADVALYAGKRNGRGKITFYHRDMEHEEAEERQIAHDLHAALLLDQLELHYQPIIEADGTICAAEALLRWRNRGRGYVPPDKFVRVAEKSEMIHRLGEWVFKRACRDLKSSGYPRFSVNVSGAQFRNDGMVDMFRRVLRESGCQANQFTLEITETVVLSATPSVQRALKELREMGFTIALDDFGTGNNSFALLRDLPVDYIKIDKSYTQRLETDKITQIFVTAIGEIAKELDMIVVAEGIETEEQQACSRIAGAVRFQGYLHGRPEPIRGQQRPAAVLEQVAS